MGTLNNVMSQLAHNMDFDKLVTIGVDDDEPSITFGALELLVYKGHETMGGTKVGPNCLDPHPPPQMDNVDLLSSIHFQLMS